MRICLLRLLFIATLHAYCFISYGQDSTSNESTRKIPEPLIILNSNVIGNGLITRLDPKKIKEIFVYKGQDGPGILNNLTSAGILAMTYDGRVSANTFAEIGHQHKVHGPFRVLLNGHSLDATQQATLRIAPEAIGAIAITPATAQNAEAIMSITIVETKPEKHAPGTIMIR